MSLAETWARISSACGPPRTLDPTRELATSLVDVHAQALAGLSLALGAELDEVLAIGMSELAAAQLDAFPANVFWDFDLIVSEIVREASATVTTAEARALVVDRFARLAGIQTLYGRSTAINFSYVHDFVYGYDWVKWLARGGQPFARPFSLEFLHAMETRARELLALIAIDDRTYPKLADDQARNPFAFSRTPDDEFRLHRELAVRGLIPVPTWLATADPSTIAWDRPWQALRLGVAVELGLAKPG